MCEERGREAEVGWALMHMLRWGADVFVPRLLSAKTELPTTANNHVTANHIGQMIANLPYLQGVQTLLKG